MNFLVKLFAVFCICLVVYMFATGRLTKKDVVEIGQEARVKIEGAVQQELDNYRLESSPSGDSVLLIRKRKGKKDTILFSHSPYSGE